MPSKTITREQQRVYEAKYRATHREAIRARAVWKRARPETKAYMAAWRAAHPERVVELNRRYYVANRETRLIEGRRYSREVWYPKNRERKKAQGAAWMRAHPVRVAEWQAVKRARRAAVFVEHVDRRVVFERDGGVCGICDGAVDPADWHLDHRQPIARGGLHCYANVQVAHPLCNMRKRDKWEDGA